MQLEKFQAGKYVKQNDFSAFAPASVDVAWAWNDTQLNFLLEQASAEIGGLNSFAELVPNIDIYIKMQIRTEANKSSRIEGTTTSIEENLMRIEDISPEKRDDYVEVHNYVDALQHGINRLTKENFPLCLRLIREMHEVLMQGARGEHKSPGEFRKSQNWVGGSMPSTAVYVPPCVPDMEIALSDFEKFLNNDENSVPHLIKAAIAHYQFETIHPFLDGNGRVGRLIIPLYLLNKGVITKPCFYISAHFERNREGYYDALNRPRQENDLMFWIKFFLTAAIDTAKSAKMRFANAVNVVNKLNERAFSVKGRIENVRAILNVFYNEPILNAKQVSEKTSLTVQTVLTTLNDMLEKSILVENTGFSRNRIFVLKEYFNVFAVKH